MQASNRQTTVTLISMSKWLVMVVAGAFVAGIGFLIAAFALALIPLDVYPQAKGLSQTMPGEFAWAFSIATSSIPLVYSFGVKKIPIKGRDGFNFGAIWVHTFFWAMRLGDALLDTMNISVLFGLSQKPSFEFLRHGFFIALVAFMMFVLSNVTDGMKDLVISAMNAYVSYTNQILQAIARSRSAGKSKPHNNGGTGIPSARAHAQQHARQPQGLKGFGI